VLLPGLDCYLGGTVMVCCVQQAGGCSGGVRICERPRSSFIESGRRGQRIFPLAAGPRPVPDPPGRSPRHGSYQENSRC
jgi:hypothetical protein